MEPDPLMPIPFRPEKRGESQPLPARGVEGADTEPLPIPDRYQRKEDEEGVYLTCLEAPEIKVRLRRELSVPAAAARKYAEGTIFLDGAAQAEPFLDLERRVYNLDHHQGCVRRFTQPWW